MESVRFDCSGLLRDLPPDMRRLSNLIKMVQDRLGTAHEQPGDLEAVRNATHEYMNLFQQYLAARHLSEPEFVTVHQRTHRPE